MLTKAGNIMSVGGPQLIMPRHVVRAYNRAGYSLLNNIVTPNPTSAQEGVVCLCIKGVLCSPGEMHFKAVQSNIDQS